MHCGNCGDTSSEVRPCHIRPPSDKKKAKNVKLSGDAWICQACAKTLIPSCSDLSDFTTWSGHPCDECRQMAAFDGLIPPMPEGIVCDQCNSPVTPERGTWLCEHCYDKHHFGHRQKELQPVLDRLSRL